MPENIAIKVENLSKVYKLYKAPIDRMKEALHLRGKKYHKDFYALNDVSFEIKKGETVGIIGKNGSGKSTLLKIITGILSSTSGKVTVNGRISALLELGAGFNPEYTGIENIYFHGNLMGYSEEDMQARLKQILDFADIGDFIHQPVKMYSSGMFARLAFAVAINVEPDILIVDEALSVGDMAFQSKCFNKFKEFRERGITILFVTHSVDTVIKYCQSAILINEGIKIKDGPSKETVELFRKMMVNLARINQEARVLEKQSEHTELNANYNLKKQLPINSKADIYGSMDAEIIDFAVINQSGQVTNQLYHDEEYIIQLSVKFYHDILDPIFAFTLRSVDGLELTGTNSINLNQSFGMIKAGEIITAKFSQNMILNAGQYFLALGCTKYYNSNLRIFHRLYDIVPIEVISTNLGVGVAFTVSGFEVIKN
jgi:ABC-type polysaccharide/polyol phosphate transport system ATPase subunit